MTRIDPTVPHDGLFVPVYRAMSAGDWQLRLADAVLCPGYWSPPRVVLGLAALVRQGQTWMSISPLEIESQEIGVRHARGHVAVFGLGMGWCAAACARRPEVTAVTVVERDPAVHEIHRRLDLFAQLEAGERAKVRLVAGDAFSWTPDRPVDTLLPDIWLPLVSDGRVDEVRRMQANVRAGEVYFWGQELEIARHAAAAGRDLDDAGIGRTVADFGLPLAGLTSPGYAARLGAAARRWMRGRWLPGTVPPF